MQWKAQYSYSNQSKNSPNIFGGFTTLAWDCNIDKFDPKAFIFSLINKEERPLKIKVKSDLYAICCWKDIGPIFGNADDADIFISSNSNTNQESYSYFGASYKHDLYPYGSKMADTFLAGSYHFSTEDIEVYQVI